MMILTAMKVTTLMETMATTITTITTIIVVIITTIAARGMARLSCVTKDRLSTWALRPRLGILFMVTHSVHAMEILMETMTMTRARQRLIQSHRLYQV